MNKIKFLSQCKAPLQFWNYAFESSNYEFPYTFECLWYLYLRLYHARKLDFCFSPSVFLGYSSSHLGYHCLLKLIRGGEYFGYHLLMYLCFSPCSLSYTSVSF